jgi:hypothetical protein
MSGSRSIIEPGGRQRELFERGMREGWVSFVRAWSFMRLGAF